MQNETLQSNPGIPPVGKPPSDLTDENQLVTFLLEGEEFGFNIMSVQEIIRLPRMAKVPRTPAYVDGIANLRGVVLPVIDMRTRFGMHRAEETDRTRVLVVDIDGVKAGLRVDHVKQVTRVLKGELEPPPKAIRGTSSDCLDGVVKLDQGKRIVMALNAARVCHIEVAQTDAIADCVAVDSHTNVGGSTTNGKHPETDVQQMVTFRIAKEEFAFHLEHVQEILRVQAPNQVPGVPPYVLGVLPVRGKILPVIDLRRLLETKSLSEEIAATCSPLRVEYEAWLDQLSAILNSGSLAKVAAPVTDRVRKWLDETNSSSQLLMEALAKSRGLNERVVKQLQAKAKCELHGESEAALECGQQALSAGREAVASLRKFEDEIGQNIHEDQRIIVLDAGGFPLGLVVDHVHEVLNVPKSLMEPPPNLATSTGMELAGVAKLDGGARLILLLAAASLVNDEKLRNIQELVPANTAQEQGEAMQKNNKNENESDDLQLVTFMLGDEEYGIPIAQVQEIDRLSKITKVPKAAPFIEGITNLRGEVVPVLDTRKRFDLAVKEPDDRTRIIIVDLGGVKTGLLVDSVRQVMNLSRKCISPPPEAIGSGQNQQFMSGIGNVDSGNRLVVLLDVEKILTRQEQEHLVETAA
jgi:purine-binding chemotaxis protein CheW